MEYKIRRLGSLDVPAAYDLQYLARREGGQLLTPLSLAEIKASCSSCTHASVVAYHEHGKIHGWLAYDINPMKSVFVRALVVHPNHRRRGIGRRLLQFLQDAGPRRVLAVVSERDLRAQVFLRQCGFACFAVDTNAYHFEWDAEC